MYLFHQMLPCQRRRRRARFWGKMGVSLVGPPSASCNAVVVAPALKFHEGGEGGRKLETALPRERGWVAVAKRCIPLFLLKKVLSTRMSPSTLF